MKKSFYLMMVAALAMTFANVSFADDAKDEASDAPKVEKEEPVFNADVPEEGSAEDYFAFIKSAQSQKNLLAKPRPANQKEFRERAVTVLKACNEATNKILAKDSLTKEQTTNAVKAKIEFVRQLARVDSSFQEELASLPQLCKDKGLDALAEELEVYDFVDKFMMALQSGKKDKAKDALYEMIEKGETEGKKITSELADGLEFVLQYAEYALEKDDVAKVYEKVLALFKNADDEEVVRSGKALEGKLRRAQLPGNEMLVGGTFIDDTEYKAEDYAGKTVLIDFWATWCGPCRGEIPNVKKLYGYYHEKGFEIIGISSDRDVETLKKFIEKEEMPWKQMMRDKALVADGQTMGSYYGVTGIPTMILIGPDGKVVTINARGAALKDALESIYGPMPKDEEADDEDEE
ncbi:MAG: TlpA family protein disulfide reductase [Thermoguttaceae bacterium]|nr:TlpA family protein disulfide reductase [Thermoguttaceae bacterium]